MDGQLNETLSNLGNNPEQAREALEALAQKAVAANGIDGSVDIELYHAKDGRMGGHKDGKIYINMAYQKDKITLAETSGDELSHYTDYRKEREYDESRQSISRGYGDGAGENIKRSSINAASNIGSLEGGDLAVFESANKEVRGIENLEERTYFINGIANDTFNGMNKDGVHNPTTYAVEFANRVNQELGRDEVVPVPGVYTSGGVKAGVFEVVSEMMNKNQYSDQITDYIKEDLKNNSLEPGEAVNFIGYSGGGQLALNIADKLEGNKRVLNVITMGSPLFEVSASNVDKVTRMKSKKDGLSYLDALGFDSDSIIYPNVNHYGDGSYLNTNQVIDDVVDLIE